MVKLHFDIRDIFRAIRLGWSGKKIWVGLCGLVAAWAGYSILVVIAHVLAGATLGQVWQRYGLFPGASPETHPPLAACVDVLAMLYALAVIFVTMCMICKITFQQLRGDDFYSSGDALRFVRRHWTGVLFGPVAVLALFVFFLIVGIVIGWLAGVIPVVGELVFSLTFIPIFFAALVAIFISIAFVSALLMSPAIVGSVGEDSLEVVIQAFSLTWSQPWRLVLYAVWLKVCVWIGTTVLAALMGAALWLTTWACGLFMGEKLSNMLHVARYYVPIHFADLEVDMMANLPSPGIPSGAEVWAGRILGVMLILILGIFLSYVLSAYASGTSLIYVILRRRKDDENLLEWEDETLLEEPEAEPVEAGAGASGTTGSTDSAPEAGAESGDEKQPEDGGAGQA